MGRLAFVCLLNFFLPVGVSAQSWCPPGATWNFQLLAWATDGYVVRTYVGDTVIQGWTAQRIHEQGEQIIYFPNSDTIQINNTAMTAVQDSVLYTRVLWNGVPAWDTLCRFDAVIGDRWFPPGADSVCMNGLEGMLEVVDTSALVVDGVTLRRWGLSYLDAVGQPIWGTLWVTERLGYEGGFGILPGGCIIIEGGEVLRCYADGQIQYNEPFWPYDCTSVTGVEERHLGIVRPAPNPGTDHFTFDLPPGPHMVEVFDVTGRNLLTQRAGGGQVTIGTQLLPSGTYLVRVDGAQPMRWLKAGSM
jgi:hypothetical protein